MQRTGAAKRVLIVDDSSVFRSMVADLLREEGLNSEPALNGRDAIAKLSANGPLPDLVLIDLLMPEVDGYELLQFMEGTPRLAHIPIIVLTMLKQPPLPPGTPILQKPLDARALREAVQACLAGSSRSEPS